MKTKRLLMTIATLCFCTAVVGCDSQISNADINNQKAKIERETDKLAAMKERRRYESEMEAKLEKLQSQINGMKEEAASAKGEAEVKLRGEIAELETRFEQVKESLDELKIASGDLWAKAKIKAEKAWGELSKSSKEKVADWKARFEELEQKDEAENLDQ
jgi:exonuclease VII large subunit